MKFTDIMDTLAGTFLFVAIVCCIIGGVALCNKKPVTPPVKESIAIDSLITTNDSLKFNINKLDSIKDVKVIEVRSLDNDSTIKLFYELVSE